jgi:chaperonin GroEL (HSP60 family)
MALFCLFVQGISANNDRSIGDLLASAIDTVGREGAISIEDGSGLESVLEVVAILWCEGRLSSLKDLLPLLEEIVKAGRPLLVIAEDLDHPRHLGHLRGQGTRLWRPAQGQGAAKLSSGVALLRARRALAQLTGSTLDETSGIRLVARAVEEPFRRIVSNAGDEPSVILNRVDESPDPAKVTRLALQNATSIASLILTTDCMIATAPKPSPESGAQLPKGLSWTRPGF